MKKMFFLCSFVFLLSYSAFCQRDSRDSRSSRDSGPLIYKGRTQSSTKRIKSLPAIIIVYKDTTARSSSSNNISTSSSFFLYQIVDDAINEKQDFQTPETQKLAAIPPQKANQNSINIFNPYVFDIRIVFIDVNQAINVRISSGKYYTLPKNLEYKYLTAYDSQENICTGIVSKNTNWDLEWNHELKSYCLKESIYLK